jgi:hypothetical protein
MKMLASSNKAKKSLSAHGVLLLHSDSGKTCKHGIC